MRNFSFGSTVRANVKLGSQKQPNWTKGMYLGNNTVEFNNGQIITLEDSDIKLYRKLSYENCDWPDRISFVQKNWDELKEVFLVAIKRFFPKKEYAINNIEHTIECEGFSISSTVQEIESWTSFDETAVWEISTIVYSAGSRDEPPSEDVKEISYSNNNHVTVRNFINCLWEAEQSNYWENVYYDLMAKEQWS